MRQKLLTTSITEPTKKSKKIIILICVSVFVFVLGILVGRVTKSDNADSVVFSADRTRCVFSPDKVICM